MKDLYHQLVALAQIVPINPDDIGVPTTDAEATLASVLNTVYFVAGAVAVIVLIVAGIMFSSSAGNTQQVARARNMAIGSVVGIVVILSAATITFFITGEF